MNRFRIGVATCIVLLCGVVGIAVGAVVLKSIDNHDHNHAFTHEHQHDHIHTSHAGNHNHEHGHNCIHIEEDK